jgi:hypothetical protein
VNFSRENELLVALSTRKLTAFCIKLFNSRRANVEEFRLLVLICLALVLIIFPVRKKVPPELAAMDH